MRDDQTSDVVKDYYGSVLSSNADLKTNACCCGETIPERHRAILATVDDEVLDRFYGCGSPLPPALDGLTSDNAQGELYLPDVQIGRAHV